MYKRKKNKFWSSRPKRIKSYFVFNQKQIIKFLYSLPLSLVIGDFVILKKTKQDYVGRCPFCRTLTQNNSYFRVSDVKRKYKCFQCGVGGTHPSSFLIRYFNKSFSDVIFYLKRKYKPDIKLEYIKRTVKSSKYWDCRDEDLPF